MANTDYEIKNYDTTNDPRLTANNTARDNALNTNNTMYNSMIADSDKYYQGQIDATKAWEEKQTQLQNEQTDFAIEKIEQQKAQATQDYTREQSGAYVDWQKQSGNYGANAEAMASQGLANTGFSESSQVSMYNTYQNRVASARDSYNRAMLNYDNAMKDARLQNSSVLAEIAYQSLQTQLELSLEGFQYKNQLLETQANKQLEIKNMYHGQYMDILGQINAENALKEQQRQYKASHDLEQAQLAQQREIAMAQLAEDKRQFNILHPATTSTGGSSSGSSSPANTTSNKLASGKTKGTGLSAVYAVNKDDTDGKSSSNKATEQSILKNFGVISAKGLLDLVERGLAKETKDKNGNTIFVKGGTINPYGRYLQTGSWKK